MSWFWNSPVEKVHSWLVDDEPTQFLFESEYVSLMCDLLKSTPDSEDYAIIVADLAYATRHHRSDTSEQPSDDIPPQASSDHLERVMSKVIDMELGIEPPIPTLKTLADIRPPGPDAMDWVYLLDPRVTMASLKTYAWPKFWMDQRRATIYLLYLWYDTKLRMRVPDIIYTALQQIDTVRAQPHLTSFYYEGTQPREGSDGIVREEHIYTRKLNPGVRPLQEFFDLYDLINDKDE